MVKLNSFYLFPTIISTFNLSSYNNQCSEIVKQIDLHTTTQNGLIKNGFRSKSSNFLDLFEDLKHEINLCVDEYTDELGILDCSIKHSWCNKYSREGVIKPHRHELSVVSGAFYPFATGYAGQIVFDNPSGIFKINEVTKNFNEYTRQQFSIDVYPGLLVLFPSWLTHYTENNQADTRYVISFDATVREY
jgi:uncharacterized protein (TIGR02466 family)